MLFNSYIFIFLFLPLALAGWYWLNRLGRYKLAQGYLVGMSLWFYGYFNHSYLFILLVSSLGNFLLSLLLEKKRSKRWSRFVFWGGLLFNLGILFYFKYFDFFLENMNAVFRTDFLLQHILLPLGISFFTFQQLSFILDRAKGRAGHYCLVDYLTFVTFFPQLIAGPIVLHSEMMPQFQDYSRRPFHRETFTKGVAQFVLGLAKKVLLADLLAVVANFGFEKTAFLDTPSAYLTVFVYALEMYFDFSGYCDMALGLGKMFGIAIPENFRRPYMAVDMKGFWKGWHITLSRFFTAYVYIPLGGSRRGYYRTMRNIMIVFVLSGLWHGAAWTYVIWGFLHGLAVVWDNLGPKLWGRLRDGALREFALGSGERIWGRAGRIRKWLAHTWYLTVTFAFFGSASMENALFLVKLMLRPMYTGYIRKLLGAFHTAELYLPQEVLRLVSPGAEAWVGIAAFLLLLLLACFLVTRKPVQELVEEKKLYSNGFNWGLVLLFVWCVISLSGVSTFLYFNF